MAEGMLPEYESASPAAKPLTFTSAEDTSSYGSVTTSESLTAPGAASRDSHTSVASESESDAAYGSSDPNHTRCPSAEVPCQIGSQRVEGSSVHDGGAPDETSAVCPSWREYRSSKPSASSLVICPAVWKNRRVRSSDPKPANEASSKPWSFCSPTDSRVVTPSKRSYASEKPPSLSSSVRSCEVQKNACCPSADPSLKIGLKNVSVSAGPCDPSSTVPPGSRL